MARRPSQVVIAVIALALLTGASGASGAYPGANGKLLFLRWNAGPASRIDLSGLNWNEIWVAEADGRRQQRVTLANFELNGVGVRSARWSPDGSRIAYATDCGNKYDSHCGRIATVQPDGHRKCVVHSPLYGSNDIGRDESPTWSPDGTRIAFALTWPEPASIHVVEANGGGLTQLIARPLGSPAWSPDGTRLAYWRQPGNVLRTIGLIATAKLDGSDEVVLASGAPVVGAHPDWSPDGKRIAFTQLHGRFAWVCVVPSARGRVRCLVRGGEPVWSPDGRFLAYTHATDVWVVRADGTHARNVTRTPQRRESAPDWQPSPTGRELKRGSDRRRRAAGDPE